MGQGYFGITDFSFLPSGQGFTPPTPPAGPTTFGVSGFLGFPFIPVAQGTGKIFNPGGGHGFRGAGKPQYGYYYHLMQQLEIQRRRRRESLKRRGENSPVTPPILRTALVDRMIQTAKEKDERGRRRIAEGQMYAVLMAVI